MSDAFNTHTNAFNTHTHIITVWHKYVNCCTAAFSYVLDELLRYVRMCLG